MRFAKPKGQVYKPRGWLKDHEGWTHVTKKMRVRQNNFKGLRYKGSKQWRDPVPKVKKMVN
jgi:hypothetical protein